MSVAVDKSKEFILDLKESKERAEGMYVASLYKNPSLYLEYELNTGLFSKQSPWAMYYSIFIAMHKRGYEVFDALSTDTFVSDTLKEKAQEHYESYGKFSPIDIMIDVVEDRNIQEYYGNVLRYNAIFKLKAIGFDIESKWDAIHNLDYKQLSDFFDTLVNDVFTDINIEEDEVVNLTDDIRSVWEEAHKGTNVGLPVDSKLLNNIIKGQVVGNLSLIGGRSGEGKTMLSICLTLPKHIEHNEPLLIMCNEEDVKIWRMQLTVWVANNVIRKTPQFKGRKVSLLKERYYDTQGGFTKDEWELIDASISWLDERIASELIKFVSFKSFSMDKSIGLIKKYTTQRNFRYFILDTMKIDNNVGSNASDLSWLHLQQGMVKLFNVIKSSNKDAHVWVTYQLKKENRRYLDMDSLGMSKNVVDVVSTLILIRNVYDSEKENGKLQIKGLQNEPVFLNEDNDYMLIFVPKNRRGSTNDVVVLKTDKNRNVITDMGLTRIAEDF